MKRTADSKDDDDDDDDGKKIASDSCVNLIELVQNQRARQFSPAHLNASNANRAGEGEEEDCDNKRAKVVSATTTTTATKVNFGVVEQKPRVLILHTGGTLGMSSDSFEENTVMNTVRSATPMSTISPLSRVASGTSGGENGANSNGAYQRTVKKGTGGHYDNKLGPSRLLTDILSAVPELSAFAKLRVRVLFNKDSCQIVPKDWCFIAEALHEARDEYDAFVLVHGTDTLAYTTSALSLMLANFGKPIIVTGSQLPLAMPRSDARQNLIDAVSCATAGFVQ
jgi:L-asparaginase/Glu-tRNA(Gln) amidotransferase subunit D